MGTLFGTDGIRGVANQYPVTAEMAVNVGRIISHIFGKNNENPEIIIGKDTRISGDMIEHALASGICSMGTHVLLAGVVPTPAISFLAAELNAAAGIVVSASHNPFFDNGIKIFDADGSKLSDDTENKIEKLLLSGPTLPLCQDIQKTGRVAFFKDAGKLYIKGLEKALPDDFSLKGVKIALDCSNGAVSEVAPELFSGYDADVTVISNRPDGFNINHECGSQHTEPLRQLVRSAGADIGLAFDGDGDRLIAVDEKGQEVSGDQILFIGAKFLKEKNVLRNNILVTTVMSNIGLQLSLKREGIEHAASKVGDRYVADLMQSKKAVLGGENSGHVIYGDHQRTGDGLLAALKLLEALRARRRPLSVLAGEMTIFPQKLINVDVKEKPDLQTIPEVTGEIRKVEILLGGKGRVLVRYSGTQQKCRVMVEGPTAEETERYCTRIADAIKLAIG